MVTIGHFSNTENMYAANEILDLLFQMKILSLMLKIKEITLSDFTPQVVSDFSPQSLNLPQIICVIYYKHFCGYMQQNLYNKISLV